MLSRLEDRIVVGKGGHQQDFGVGGAQTELLVLVNPKNSLLFDRDWVFHDFAALPLKLLKWIIDIPCFLVHMLEHNCIVAFFAVHILSIHSLKVSACECFGSLLDLLLDGMCHSCEPLMELLAFSEDSARERVLPVVFGHDAHVSLLILSSRVISAVTQLRLNLEDLPEINGEAELLQSLILLI